MPKANKGDQDRTAAAKAVSMLLVHHRLKVATPVRKAMESLHLSATRRERSRKNTKTDAEIIRDYLARRVLSGKGMPSGADVAAATGIPSKDTHAQLAMMRKRAK